MREWSNSISGRSSFHDPVVWQRVHSIPKARWTCDFETGASAFCAMTPNGSAIEAVRTTINRTDVRGRVRLFTRPPLVRNGTVQVTDMRLGMELFIGESLERPTSKDAATIRKIRVPGNSYSRLYCGRSIAEGIDRIGISTSRGCMRLGFSSVATEAHIETV